MRNDIVRVFVVLGVFAFVYVYLALPGTWAADYLLPLLLIGIAGVGRAFVEDHSAANSVQSLKKNRGWVLFALGVLGLILAYAVIPGEGGPVSGLSAGSSGYWPLCS